ncbi:MAG: cytochrome c maturation protein CcmE [Bacteroidota bacterium]
MKKIHIIGILMVGLAIFLLTQAAGDVGQYSSFADATEANGKVKIVGQLSKDKPMIYEPDKDPNLFKFYMKDQDGKEKQVMLLKEKPMDFEKSEQIVLTGQMNGEAFVATDILMKCPSKYKDEEMYLRDKG